MKYVVEIVFAETSDITSNIVYIRELFENPKLEITNALWLPNHHKRIHMYALSSDDIHQNDHYVEWSLPDRSDAQLHKFATVEPKQQCNGKTYTQMKVVASTENLSTVLQFRKSDILMIVNNMNNRAKFAYYANPNEQKSKKYIDITSVDWSKNKFSKIDNAVSVVINTLNFYKAVESLWKPVSEVSNCRTFRCILRHKTVDMYTGERRISCGFYSHKVAAFRSDTPNFCDGDDLESYIEL